MTATSREAISEIISYLCSVVSFIVLDLIRYFITNIRTLELTHVYTTVSRRFVIPQYDRPWHCAVSPQTNRIPA